MKAKKAPTKEPACPICGQELITSEADPRGRPMCKGVLSGLCGYVGAATKTPTPAKWGRREHAHLAAVEKYLAELHPRAEVESMLDVNNHKARASAFGPCGLAFDAGRARLIADLRARDMRAEGMNVVRRGNEVEEGTADVVHKFNARMDHFLKVSGTEGKPTRGQLLVDEVRKRLRDGMTLIEVCRSIASDAYGEAGKTGASPWMRKPLAIAANKACLRGDKPTKQDVERLAQTLKRERNRALEVRGAKPKRTK